MGETGVWVEKSNYPFELIKVDNGKVAAVSAARAPAAGAPPPPRGLASVSLEASPLYAACSRTHSASASVAMSALEKPPRVQ